MNARSDLLTASFRVTTPMFLSGADQTQTELRLPSFKGALRFWWRALNWGQDDLASIADLKHAEARLFGGTGSGEGQAMFLLRIAPDTTIETGNQAHFKQGTCQGYAGYGLTDAKDRLNRQFITPGSQFQVQVRGPRAQASDWQQLRQALQALGLLGGLGGRSRKGWGSLTLTGLDGVGDAWSAPDTESSLRAGVDAFFTQSSTGTDPPPFSAFSRFAQIKICAACKNADAAHQQLAKDYQEQVEASSPKSHREGFGLPRKTAGENAGLRRASPVFLHVHQVDANGPALPVVTFLPAQFLGQQPTPCGDWAAVQALLDRVQP